MAELPRPMVGDKCYLYRLVCCASKDSDGIKRIEGDMKCYEASITSFAGRFRASYYENGKSKNVRISDEGYNHVFFNNLVLKKRDDMCAVALFRKAELNRINSIKRELADACGKHTMLCKMEMSVNQSKSLGRDEQKYYESAQYEYFWDDED